MRKIAVVILATALLIVSLSVPAALAAPAQKMAFTARQAPILVQPPSPNLKAWTTEGDTVHIRNLNGAGRINSSLAAAWMNPSYQGTTSSVIQNNINLKTGEGSVVYEMTWTFSTGSFHGNLNGRMSAAPYTEIGFLYAHDLHGVLVGDGEFEGWKIMVDGGKAAGMAPFIWGGTVVVPR